MQKSSKKLCAQHQLGFVWFQHRQLCVWHSYTSKLQMNATFPLRRKADELNMLMGYLASQYWMCHHLRVTRAHAKTFCEKSKPEDSQSLFQLQKNWMQRPHERIMAECLVCVIYKAVHGHRLVQTYKHCSYCLLGLPWSRGQEGL